VASIGRGDQAVAAAIDGVTSNRRRQKAVCEAGDRRGIERGAGENGGSIGGQQSARKLGVKYRKLFW